MKSIKRLSLKQPPHKHKVIELEIGGRLGRWFWNHDWGAFTFPLPLLTIIMYWSTEATLTGTVDPLIRVHEWTHVKQIDDGAFFAVVWVHYLWAIFKNLTWSDIRAVGVKQALLDAYYQNKYEAEAYAVEDLAENNGLPDWAK